MDTKHQTYCTVIWKKGWVAHSSVIRPFTLVLVELKTTIATLTQNFFIRLFSLWWGMKGESPDQVLLKSPFDIKQRMQAGEPFRALSFVSPDSWINQLHSLVFFPLSILHVMSLCCLSSSTVTSPKRTQLTHPNSTFFKAMLGKDILLLVCSYVKVNSDSPLPQRIQPGQLGPTWSPHANHDGGKALSVSLPVVKQTVELTFVTLISSHCH